MKYVRAAGPPIADGRDPFNVPSMFFPDTVTGAELIAFVEATTKRGGLGVMGFHGVGGDYLTVSADAHRQLGAVPESAPGRDLGRDVPPGDGLHAEGALTATDR